MRIGLDISTLTLKKQADTIVLVAGDSDFVPAAKLARREGVEFVLDPLWQKINADLFEHIDGLQSTVPGPGSLRAPGGRREGYMARMPKPRFKEIESLTHDEAKRRNIPTAEMQSLYAARAGGGAAEHQLSARDAA